MNRLTHRGSNENPRWSPDGLHIVFSSNRTGKYEVYSMHWDGSSQRRITGEGENYNPSWSPRF
jgi:TolB protein